MGDLLLTEDTHIESFGRVKPLLSDGGQDLSTEGFAETEIYGQAMTTSEGADKARYSTLWDRCGRNRGILHNVALDVGLNYTSLGKVRPGLK